MAFDYSQLMKRIIDKCGTQYNFAEKLGLSERSVSLKLNGKVWWKQNEIDSAMEILDIDRSDVGEFFFKPKVQIN